MLSLRDNSQLVDVMLRTMHVPDLSTPVGLSAFMLKVGGEPSIGQGALRRGQGQYSLKEQAQGEQRGPCHDQEGQQTRASTPHLYHNDGCCQAAAGYAHYCLQITSTTINVSPGRMKPCAREEAGLIAADQCSKQTVWPLPLLSCCRLCKLCRAQLMAEASHD